MKLGIIVRKKLLFSIVVCIAFCVAANVWIFNTIRPDVTTAQFDAELNVQSAEQMELQVFYSQTKDFSEEQSVRSILPAAQRTGVKLTAPVESSILRLDFGTQENTVIVFELFLKAKNDTIRVAAKDLHITDVSPDVTEIEQVGETLTIQTKNEDPYIIVDISTFELGDRYLKACKQEYLVYDVLLCILVVLVVCFCFLKRRKILAIPKTVIQKRKIVWNLTCNDFRSRFAGSYFGVFWAFVQPMITVVLYWFVFQVGLRAGAISEYPFVLYLISGLIPWFYFSEALNGGTQSLLEYSYLVKKVVFQIEILPAGKVFASLFVHLFFIGFAIVFCCFFGYYPSLYLLQIPYYCGCLILFVIGVSYLTSASVVFFRDIAQIINIILTIGIWVTPIMWNPAITMDLFVQVLLKINPIYYIVEGYRDCLLMKVWFWEKPIWTLWFWFVTLATYYLGITVFNRLKPHFSDML